MYTEIRFTLNGEQKLYQGDPLRRLLDVLREDYGLTGSKEGCGEGECGACSIIKNGKLIRAGSMAEVRGDASLETVFLELEGGADER